MSLDQGISPAESSGFFVPVEEEAQIDSRHRAKAEGTLSECLYLAQGHLRKPTIKMPVFGEGPLQASSRPCVSLTAVGEAEIVNRMRPGAHGPPVE